MSGAVSWNLALCSASNSPRQPEGAAHSAELVCSGSVCEVHLVRGVVDRSDVCIRANK